MLSVVVPTLNAGRVLPRTLQCLASAAAEGAVRDVVVADGGSTDETIEIAEETGCAIVRAERGRGRQLAAGAARARGPWLLFLHADTVLEDGWTAAARSFMANHPDEAAAFRFALDDQSGAARRLEAMVAARCAVFRMPYGDQGLLIARDTYDAVGGYGDMPLFEDVDIVRRLGRRRMRILPARAVTCAARFKRGGYMKRSARNLVLLARYFFGAPPSKLARAYE